MSQELIVKKCMKCGAIVKVIKDCTCENCGIQCCGEQMKVLEPNSVDAAVEKHVPTYEVRDGKIRQIHGYANSVIKENTPEYNFFKKWLKIKKINDDSNFNHMFAL